MKFAFSSILTCFREAPSLNRSSITSSLVFLNEGSGARLSSCCCNFSFCNLILSLRSWLNNLRKLSISCSNRGESFTMAGKIGPMDCKEDNWEPVNIKLVLQVLTWHMNSPEILLDNEFSSCTFFVSIFNFSFISPFSFSRESISF